MPDTIRDHLLAEAPLAVVALTAALLWARGGAWLADRASPVATAALTAWLFAVILAAAFAAVRHADALAEQLGEPLGTLVLTLSVTGIEVLMVSAVMLTGAENPHLARDTMYGVVMIVLNGLAADGRLHRLAGGRGEEPSGAAGGARVVTLRRALLVLALALAGCVVGRDYRPPDPVVPARWSEAPQQDVPMAAAPSLSRNSQSENAGFTGGGPVGDVGGWDAFRAGEPSPEGARAARDGALQSAAAS